jgi:ABC-type Zn uptake system ZnuABC Zn-binding protein ZnuA
MYSPVYAMGGARRALNGAQWSRRLLTCLSGLLCMTWLAACGPASTARPPLKVVATIAPLADWAQQVGREHVTVTQLAPIGVDPSTYRPTAADREALRQADVLLLNGLDLEPWLDGAIRQAKPAHMVSLRLSEFVGQTVRTPTPIGRSQLSPDSLNANPQNESTIIAQPNYSRYLWLDPGPDFAQRSVMLIADTFARVDPDRLMVYRRNAERYNGELENLDNWIKRQVRAWPRVKADSRKILAWQSVDRSWHYFAARYGVNLRNTDSLRSIEPALPETTPFFVDRFRYEADQPLTADLRTPDAVLNPLSDASYIKMIRANVNLMTQGLNHAARNASAPLNPLPEAP